MAILLSNLFIFFLFLIFQNRKILYRLGFPIAVLLVLLTCIRMIFPVELLPISHNIYMPEHLSVVIGELRRVRFIHNTLSWWNLLEILWGCGILLQLLKYLKRNYSFHKYVENYGIPLNPSCMQMQIFSQIRSSYPQRRIQKITLVSVPLLKSPCIFGFTKPKILIPDTLHLSDTEWNYVFSHEINHYIQNDLYIKGLLHLICIIYWWNPFCYFLKKSSDTLLEMRIDHSIADTPEQKSAYLSCLLKMSSFSVEGSLEIPDFTIGFFNSVLVQRFETITEYTKPQHTSLLKVLSLLFVFFLYIGSYFIIFEDNYFPPDQFTDDVIIPTLDNCFLIESPTGGYDFYLCGEYIETLPDKEYCISDIHTYKDIDEARNHEQIIHEK